MFDDREHLTLNKYNELEKLITDNYGLFLKGPTLRFISM